MPDTDALAKRIEQNIEAIEFTLRDPEWQPRRSYVEKMLGAYKEAAAALSAARAEALEEAAQVVLTRGLWGNGMERKLLADAIRTLSAGQGGENG